MIRILEESDFPMILEFIETKLGREAGSGKFLLSSHYPAADLGNIAQLRRNFYNYFDEYVGLVEEGRLKGLISVAPPYPFPEKVGMTVAGINYIYVENEEDLEKLNNALIEELGPKLIRPTTKIRISLDMTQDNYYHWQQTLNDQGYTTDHILESHKEMTLSRPITGKANQKGGSKT